MGSRIKIIEINNISFEFIVFMVAEVYSDNPVDCSGDKTPLEPLGAGVGPGNAGNYPSYM